MTFKAKRFHKNPRNQSWPPRISKILQILFQYVLSLLEHCQLITAIVKPVQSMRNVDKELICGFIVQHVYIFLQ